MTMLTADQIEALGDQAQKIMEPVVEFLIRDVAQRISQAGQLTGTAAYQVWQLQQLGLSQRQIKKELKKRLKVTDAALEKLLTQAAKTGYDYDLRRFPHARAVPFGENETVQHIVKAAVEMAQKDLSNMVRTLGFVCPDGEARPLTKAYRALSDFAFRKMALGAQDYNSAVREATKALVDKGVVSINYASGVHTSVEAAVRRNVMGGLGLMQERINEHIHDSFGCDGWEISAHAASAPDHEPIQGRQYTDEAFHNLNNSLQRRIGTLNCGHAAFPILLGIQQPQYTPEELEKFRTDNAKGVTYNGRHYTMYEATQHQRKLERSIRKQKRRILIDEQLGDEQQLAIDQTKLVRLNDEYLRFSHSTGLRTQLERTRVECVDISPGWPYNGDRKQYERYRDVLKDRVPESLVEFQQLKRENPNAWEILKNEYRVVNQYKIDSGEFTVDEMLKLDDQLITEKRQNFKSAYKKSGNIAGAYVDQDYYLAHSRIETPEEANGYRGASNFVTLRTNRTFKYIDVKKAGGSLRTDTFQDTEAKLFEEFAAMYESKPFKTITMISERGMCDSCRGVMEQFKARFPDVTVRIISHKKVEGDVWKYRRRKNDSGI